MLGHAAAGADPVANELLRLGEETTLLKARAKRLEAQGQVAAMQRQLEQRPDAGAAPAFAVLSIEGLGPTLYATILLASGMTQDVVEADVLEQDLRIVSVKPGEVTYQRGKSRPVSVRVNPSSTQVDLARKAETPPGATSSDLRFPGLPPAAAQPFQPGRPASR
jgi:hypothetical protein